MPHQKPEPIPATSEQWKIRIAGYGTFDFSGNEDVLYSSLNNEQRVAFELGVELTLNDLVNCAAELEEKCNKDTSHGRAKLLAIRELLGKVLDE